MPIQQREGRFWVPELFKINWCIELLLTFSLSLLKFDLIFHKQDFLKYHSLKHIPTTIILFYQKFYWCYWITINIFFSLSRRIIWPHLSEEFWATVASPFLWMTSQHPMYQIYRTSIALTRMGKLLHKILCFHCSSSSSITWDKNIHGQLASERFVDGGPFSPLLTWKILAIIIGFNLRINFVRICKTFKTFTYCIEPTAFDNNKGSIFLKRERERERERTVKVINLFWWKKNVNQQTRVLTASRHESFETRTLMSTLQINCSFTNKLLLYSDFIWLTTLCQNNFHWIYFVSFCVDKSDIS